MATPQENATATTQRYGESLAKTAVLTTAAGLAITKFGDATKRFTDTAVRASAALVATATATVSLASPGTTYRFQLALRDLGAVIGRILVPVLEYATKLVRTLADVILNLPEGLKNFIGTFGKVVVTIGAIALVFKVITSVVGVVTGAFTSLTGTLTALTTAASAAAAATSAQATASGAQAVAGGAAGRGAAGALGASGIAAAATAAIPYVLAAVSIAAIIGSLIGEGGALTGGLADAAKASMENGRKSSVGAAVAPSRKTTGDELYSSLVTAALSSQGPGSDEKSWRQSMLDAMRQVVANTVKGGLRDSSDRILTGRG